ncbi:hypothetical protein AMS68_007596 [Peltaster fructicola]|uniref:BRCT domain-containing protein n=1 Tax=Peltaster fructicola TaxID=286661 RepID=A0A6H0Y5H3_9PEZI|nr:hypothetical protein AMS68_007596 [Peltaster fructicola]
MDDQDCSKLFEGVAITIIPSDDVTTQQEQLIITSVTDNGGNYISSTAPEGYAKLNELTHIISTHIDFPDYTDALDAAINVVKPNWISDSIAKGRLVTPRQYSPDPSQFFNDVIVTCGTLPESDEDAIIAGVIALGGQYSSPLTKIVTHIVTMDMDSEKCRLAREKHLPVRIVLPHWFDDCLKLGKKIDERPYELPDPQILRHDVREPVTINPALSVVGASAAKPEENTVPISPSKPRKALNVFHSKKIYLASDLELSKHLNSTLSGLIANGGGSVTKTLDAADVYIGHYRESSEFVDAFLAEKTIANLAWLYHVINTNRWTSPERKLLHYPVPHKGIPGFDDLRISVSNYSGDARTYVQNLVKECGASFTKTMKQDNTHLITAHRLSEKCDAAQEWGINMVNHLWLEDSYAKCAAQSLTNPEYTTFPSRTNLGEICGQVGIDVKRIEHVYVLPRLEQRSRKPVQRRLFEPAAEPQDDASTDEGAPSPIAKPHSTPIIVPVGKENQTPTVLSTGGRAAKAKALGTLHKQADDIALFNKEMKRKGGLVHGRDRQTEAKSKKRPSDSFQASAQDGDLSGDSARLPDNPRKKAKPAPAADHALPPIAHRLMVTGDDRWTGKPAKESTDRTKLRQLGILLTQDPKNVDILVAPKILRTRKFVVAIANAPLVVNSAYLDTALDKGELMTTPPALTDKAAERLYDFKLSEALGRAKVNDHKLFRGWDIFVSDHLVGGFDTYKEIISANGGNALAFRGGRRGMTLKRRIADDPEAGQESQNQGGDDELNYAYLVAGDSEEEKALWQQFQELSTKQNLQARVVKADWLLLAALTQQIRYDAKWDWSTGTA